MRFIKLKNKMHLSRESERIIIMVLNGKWLLPCTSTYKKTVQLWNPLGYFFCSCQYIEKWVQSKRDIYIYAVVNELIEHICTQKNFTGNHIILLYYWQNEQTRKSFVTQFVNGRRRKRNTSENDLFNSNKMKTVEAKRNVCVAMFNVNIRWIN